MNKTYKCNMCDTLIEKFSILEQSEEAKDFIV